MKTKIVAAATLFFFSFLTLIIILFGLTTGKIFSFLFFSFSLIWLVTLVFSLRKNFEDKSNFSIALIMTILVALSLTFFAANVKAYLEKNDSLLKENELITQISEIENINDGYNNYLAYLQKEITTSEANIKNLESELIKIKSNSSQIKNESPIIKKEEPIIIEKYREEDYEERDDD